MHVEAPAGLQISARNVLRGRVVKVIHDMVNAEVTLQLPGGGEIVSVITQESAERLGLAEGKDAYAVIKASDVMIATD